MLRTISSSSATSKIVRRIITSRNILASYSTTTHERDTRQQLLELLRHTAQPVAVVTALMRSNNDEHRYHGATLSSFASIAMDPYPLISFALRIPSRMAFSLKSAFHDRTSHMVVNLLSSEQATVAVKFSRPDLHPEPFHSVPYSLTQEGLPVLDGSLGSLSCQLVSDGIPLHDLSFFGKGDLGGDVACDAGDMVVSELFIGRVVRVERLEVGNTDEENPRTLPLIYHRRALLSNNPWRELEGPAGVRLKISHAVGEAHELVFDVNEETNMSAGSIPCISPVARTLVTSHSYKGLKVAISTGTWQRSVAWEQPMTRNNRCLLPTLTAMPCPNYCQSFTVVPAQMQLAYPTGLHPKSRICFYGYGVSEDWLIYYTRINFKDHAQYDADPEAPTHTIIPGHRQGEPMVLILYQSVLPSLSHTDDEADSGAGGPIVAHLGWETTQVVD